MTFHRVAGLLVVFLVLTGCQNMGSMQNAGLNPRALQGPPVYRERSSETKGLSQEDADQRASVVSQVKYGLSFNLSPEDANYSGEETLNFNLSVKQPVTLDFKEGQITNLTVNGRVISTPTYNGQFLTLSNELSVGVNTVEIKFYHPYSNSGSGLYRFKDPEDSKTYLYTDFEPFEASKLFPCFDQPDLKARYKIRAEVPKDWTVISSASVENIKPTGSERRLWTFRDSDVFSTYLVSLHAGPYKMWSGYSGKIPLRLFSRQTLAKYVDAKEWLKISQQGLKFYQNYFNVPYPFKKFDQIIVPDFNEGAMENVAAITFSERYIKRGKPTKEDREHIASVILHEMAHMWFGDLVTMKWWNDLWLNESFATFSSALSQFDATEFKASWSSFFVNDKQGAYREDQLVTTHPVAGIVKNTEDAFTNFDGITYGKGASVLRQLAYYIGEPAFKKGIREYFKTYAYKNATLDNFMAALQSSSTADLSHWKAEWLQTAGLNTIESKFNCIDGKIEQFSLLQTGYEGHGILRSHRTQLALFERDMYGNVKVQKIIPVTYSAGETPVTQLKGVKCPVLVYPNYGDYDYVKIKLDPITLTAVKFQLSKIVDPFTRLMFWASLWEMTREAEIPLQVYTDLMFNHLSTEKDYKTVDFVLSTLYGGRHESSPGVLKFLQSQDPKQKIGEVAYRSRLETFLLTSLDKSVPGSDFQKRYFDAYVRGSSTVLAQDKLKGVLKGDVKFPDLEIDQDRRWNILIRLSSLNAPGIDDLVAAEKVKDPSSEGVKQVIACDVAKPLPQVKKTWFDRFVGQSSSSSDLNFSQTRTAMRNIFPIGQEALRAQTSEFFYSNMEKVAQGKDSQVQEEFSSDLVPSVCEDSSVKALSDYLVRQPKLTPVVVKNLKISLQEDERCVKVRKLVDFTSFR